MWQAITEISHNKQKKRLVLDMCVGLERCMEILEHLHKDVRETNNFNKENKYQPCSNVMCNSYINECTNG